MKNVFVTTVQNVIQRLVAVYVLLAGKDHLVKKVSWNINPFVSNEILHPYKLDVSISNLKVVVLFLTIPCMCLGTFCK